MRLEGKKLAGRELFVCQVRVKASHAWVTQGLSLCQINGKQICSLTSLSTSNTRSLLWFLLRYFKDICTVLFFIVLCFILCAAVTSGSCKTCKRNGMGYGICHPGAVPSSPGAETKKLGIAGCLTLSQSFPA